MRKRVKPSGDAPIAIMVAMDSEMKSLLSMMDNASGDFPYVEGVMADRPVVVAQAGVGKVHAAITALTLVRQFKPSCLIGAGVAGAVSKAVGIGHVVISNRTVQHDFDCTAHNLPRGHIYGLKERFFVSDPKLVELAERSALAVLPKDAVHVGTIATGDQFVTDSEVRAGIEREFDALALEMEGGAIGQVALLCTVPYVIIRSISDKADGQAGETYLLNLEDASQRMAAIVRGIVAAY